MTVELGRPRLASGDAAARETVRLLSAIIERTLGDEGRAALAVGPDGGIAFASGEALALLGDLVAREPTYALARVCIGFAHLERGRYGEAIEHLAELVVVADV